MAKDNNPKNAVATTSEKAKALVTGPAPDDLVKDAIAHAGQGVSMAAEDNLIAILTVLQPLSPQCIKGDPKRMDGAEAGHILLTSTGKLWPGETGLLFQPTNLMKAWVEWIPRDAGGGGGNGFVATHAELPKEAIQVPNPQKPDGRPIWMTKDKKHIFVETRYRYGNIIDPETGEVTPAVIPLSSTGHTVDRSWNSLMKTMRVPDGQGGTVIAQSYAQGYWLRTIAKKNASGTWYVLKPEAAGWLSAPLRDLGKQLHADVASGAKIADMKDLPDDADTDEPQDDKI